MEQYIDLRQSARKHDRLRSHPPDGCRFLPGKITVQGGA